MKLSFWIDKKLFEKLHDIKAKKMLRAYSYLICEATKYVLDKYEKGELEIERTKNGVRIIEVEKEKGKEMKEIEKVEEEIMEVEEESIEEVGEIAVEGKGTGTEEEEIIIAGEYTPDAYEEAKRHVLRILREKGETTLKELKEKFGQDDGWISWLVSNMELDDLVEIKGKVIVLKEG